jgi:hypothetical protein
MKSNSLGCDVDGQAEEDVIRLAFLMARRGLLLLLQLHTGRFLF